MAFRRVDLKISILMSWHAMSHHHEKRTQFFYEPDPLICHKKKPRLLLFLTRLRVSKKSTMQSAFYCPIFEQNNVVMHGTFSTLTLPTMMMYGGITLFQNHSKSLILQHFWLKWAFLFLLFAKPFLPFLNLSQPCSLVMF